MSRLGQPVLGQPVRIIATGRFVHVAVKGSTIYVRAGLPTSDNGGSLSPEGARQLRDALNEALWEVQSNG